MSNNNNKVTSLSAQLKKLQVPHAKWLLSNESNASHRRVSFLYDPKEAANMDSESVYCLGINGLDQLKLIDNTLFSSFDESLFSSTSIQFERAVQTKEVNAKLSDEITRFLHHLSPYFMLKASHKCIEWLVYRYHIHHYEVNQFLLSILPYHETNYFIRALQMIDLNEHPQWQWLAPSQKAGVPIASHTVSQHLVHDLSFFNLLIAHINHAEKCYNNPDEPHLNGINLTSTFLTKILLQSIDLNGSKLNEQFLAQLLPFLYNQLKSSKHMEMRQSAYLAISMLHQKCVFLKESTEKSVYALVKSVQMTPIEMQCDGDDDTALFYNDPSEELALKSALMAICIVVQSQKQAIFTQNFLIANGCSQRMSSSNFISKSAMKKLIKNVGDKRLIAQIDALNEEKSISDFIKCFIDRLLIDFFDGCSEYDSVLTKLITTINIKDVSLTDYLIENLFQLLSKAISVDSDDNGRQKMVIKLLKKLEMKYPKRFDEILSKLASKSGDEDLEKAIAIFSLKSNVVGFKYASVEGTNLSLALVHHNELVREKAMDYLRETLGTKTHIDESFYKEQLRLKIDSDPSYRVLKSLLAFKKDLTRFISISELCAKVIERLFSVSTVKDRSEELCGCRRAAIELLFNCMIDEVDREVILAAFMTISCFLIEINADELVMLLVKSTKFVADVLPSLQQSSIKSLFRDMQVNLAKNKKISEAYLNSIAAISQVDNINLKNFFDLELLLNAKSSNKAKLLKVFSILNALKESISSAAKASTHEISLKELKKDTNIDEYMNCVKSQKVDAIIFMRIFTKFIDISLESTENDLKEAIFSHLSINSANRNLVYILLLDYFAHANADKHFTNFLLSILLRQKASESIEESVVKLRSLHLLNNMIESELSEPDLTVISLTHTLTNPNQTIRIEALKCLEKVKNYDTKWHSYIKKLLKTREELEMDCEYISNGSKLSKILTKEHLNVITELIPQHTILLSLLRNIDESLKASFTATILSLIKTPSSEIQSLALKFYLINPQTAEFFNKNGQELTYILTSGSIDKLSLIQTIATRSDFFTNLSTNLQHEIIDTYFDSLLGTEMSLQYEDLKNSLVKLLRNAQYFTHLAQKHLKNLISVQNTNNQAKTTKEMKKALQTTNSTEIQSQIDLSKVRLFISLLHSRLSIDTEPKLSNSDTLITHLFSIIQYALEQDCQESFDEQQVDSIQITILNCLSQIYTQLNRDSLNESLFNMDLLVQLLKHKPKFNKNSLQVQQNVLILLSEVAPIFADKVLEHVITMFVFVGDKLARKDDLYSFEIINKTIDTILPSILNSKLSKTAEKSSMGINATIAKVLQSFVVSLGHIPAHRKWPIFSRLLRIIGVDEFLWLTAIQLIDFYLIENRANADKSALKGAMSAFTALYVQFEAKHVLNSAISLIEFIQQYLNAALFKEAKKSQFDAIGCQFEQYTQLEDKYLIYHLVVFLNDLLVDDSFRSKFDAEKLFECFLEKILITILSLNKQIKGDKLSSSSDDMKFVKSMLNKMYDCMENAINCLDSHQFISVVRKLLKHEQLAVKRRVLSLLNARLRRQEPSEDETSLLLALIDDLIDALQLQGVGGDADANEIEIYKQSILFSFKLLSKRIGDRYSMAFAKVLKYLCENLLTKNGQSCNMLSSVLLCLGELCLKLKSSALPHLNKVMQFLLELLETKETLANNLLVLSSVTCLLKIVQSLSNFLSPYLKRILNLSASLVPVKSENSDMGSSRVHNISVSSDIGALMDIEQPMNSSQGVNSKTLLQLDAKLCQLRTCLATSVSVRLLAPIIHEETNVIGKAALSSNIRLDNVEYYMQMVKMAVKSSSQEDIVANIKSLRALFMNLFNLRTLNAAYKSPKELCKYEDFVLDTFCEMTLKLSEELFRPMFFRVYEWATMNDPPKDRLITFYRLTYKLSDRLKNLFVLFSSHFIMNAVQTLDALNESKSEEGLFINTKERTKFTFATEKSSLLLFNLVNTLSNVFLHDTDKFILNNDRFGTIMQPLVDQIENEIEYDSYKRFIDECLSNCIRNFAALCSHDDILCRKLNYQILLKTKSNSVQVRLASLTVLDKVSKQMGDMYNSIFTETAPFLAELMEDPVEEVEEKVQKYIKELEEMLGESLQSHFV